MTRRGWRDVVQVGLSEVTILFFPVLRRVTPLPNRRFAWPTSCLLSDSPPPPSPYTFVLDGNCADLMWLHCRRGLVELFGGGEVGVGQRTPWGRTLQSPPLLPVHTEAFCQPPHPRSLHVAPPKGTHSTEACLHNTQAIAVARKYQPANILHFCGPPPPVRRTPLRTDLKNKQVMEETCHWNQPLSPPPPFIKATPPPKLAHGCI